MKNKMKYQRFTIVICYDMPCLHIPDIQKTMYSCVFCTDRLPLAEYFPEHSPLTFSSHIRTTNKSRMTSKPCFGVVMSKSSRSLDMILSRFLYLFICCKTLPYILIHLWNLSCKDKLFMVYLWIRRNYEACWFSIVWLSSNADVDIPRSRGVTAFSWDVIRFAHDSIAFLSVYCSYS